VIWPYIVVGAESMAMLWIGWALLKPSKSDDD